MEIERKIQELGYTLPEPRPSPYFSQGEIVGDLLFTSAHTGGPIRNGEMMLGKLGAELTFEDGYEACRTVMLLILARAKAVLGDLDRIERIIKITGYVACAPGFYEASQAMHAASELVHALWGEKGRHARTTVTVPQLSGNFPVEIEMIAQIKV
jgi:enamine deaminase RidA (YjgF/YER057c/UK114 family)